MERLNEADNLSEKAEAPAPGRRGIRSRWLTTCLLPVAIVTLVADALFAGYMLVILGSGDIVPVLIVCACLLITLVAVWVMGEIFLRTITEPLEQLQSQAQRMTERSFGVKTEKMLDDELGDLTDTLNELDTEIAQDRAVQSEFVSSVSHELRTPLTAIMGWAEAMESDDAIEGDSKRGIAIIEKESARLTKMVAELLDFTRIQDGRFNLNLEAVDIASEVEDALFTYRNLLEEEGLTLKYRCDEDEIPEIQCDPERLKQVVLNVLDNAAKYGKGGKTIEVNLTAEENVVVLTVRDHGPGIPPEELPHVKERFFKGSSKERGSGIGLAVCEEIVTRHGGRLTIANAEDGGVLVTVRLPVRQNPKKHAAPEPAAKPKVK